MTPCHLRPAQHKPQAKPSTPAGEPGIRSPARNAFHAIALPLHPNREKGHASQERKHGLLQSIQRTDYSAQSDNRRLQAVDYTVYVVEETRPPRPVQLVWKNWPRGWSTRS